MFVTHEREKLLNAINYFLRTTKHAHTLKLFKLLYFLDFEHFRQAGRTVTGLDYKALPKGPVPTKLELKSGGQQDLKSAILLFEVRDQFTDELLRRDLKPKVPFDSKFFTKRELGIMELVSFFFKELRAEDMSEFSHANKKPWKEVFAGGKGVGRLIAPELILDTEPLMADVPTIDRDELEFRRELLRDTA